MSYCLFTGHEEENLLGFCFHRQCQSNPQFCYTCKQEIHLNHQTKCIRFDQLQRKIVEVHNQFLDQINQNKQYLKQAQFYFQQNVQPLFQNIIDQCQLLFNQLNEKNYQEATLQMSSFYYYQQLEQDKIKNIKNVLEQYFQINQQQQEKLIKEINQILQDTKVGIEDDETQSDQSIENIQNLQQSTQEQIKNKNNQQQNTDQIQEKNDKDDELNECIIQMLLKDSEEEAQYQIALKSQQIIEQVKLNLYNPNQALSELEKVIQHDQNNQEAILLKQQIQSGKLQESFKEFNQEMAQSLSEYKLLAEEEQQIANLIIQHPQESILYSKRAKILNEMSRFKEAIDVCDQAIQINKNNSSAYNNKAFALEYLNKPEEALTNYDLAIELSINEQTFWVNKVRLLLKMKKIEEAAICLNELEKQQPLNESSLSLKCDILINYGYIKEAYEICIQGLTDYPLSQYMIQIKTLLEQLLKTNGIDPTSIVKK